MDFPQRPKKYHPHNISGYTTEVVEYDKTQPEGIPCVLVTTASEKERISI